MDEQSRNMEKSSIPVKDGSDGPDEMFMVWWSRIQPLSVTLELKINLGHWQR